MNPRSFVIDKVMERDLEFLSLFGDSKGKDYPFLSYLEFQPCKSCGVVPHWQMDTFMKNEACHVRRVASGSGTAIKPQWSATTMCHQCHKREHHAGGSSVAPQEVFDRWADESLASYITMALIKDLGVFWESELPGWLKTKGISACG